MGGKDVIGLFCFCLFMQMLTSAQSLLPNLTDNYNYSLYKDSHAFTWISSINGLNRFDGHKTKNYWPDKISPHGLNEGLIQSEFFEDTESNLWFSTDNYLQRYNRLSDNFDHFVVDSDSLSSYKVIGFVEDDDLWVQIETYVYSFNINTYKWTRIFSGFQAIDFSIDKKQGELRYIYGTRWSFGDGLLRLNCQKGIPISVDTLFSDWITTRIIQNNKDHWVASDKGMIIISSEDEVQQIKTDKGVSSIAFIDEHTALVCKGNSVFTYNIKNRKFIALDISADLKSFHVFYFNDGNIYINTLNSGLYKYRYDVGSPWNVFSSDASIHSISSYVYNNQHYLSYFDVDGMQVTLNLAEGVYYSNKIKPYASIIERENKKPLIVSNGSLYSYEPSSNSLKEISNCVKSTGLIGVGLKNDLAVFDYTGVQILDSQGIVKKQLFETYFFDFATKIKNRIVVDFNDGIAILKMFSDSIYFEKVIKDNFLTNHIYKFSDSTVLVSTYVGIKLLDINSGEVRDYGFEDQYINSAIVTSSGELWASTHNSLLCRDINNKIYTYNINNGLPINGFISNCVAATPDGRLWWGTQKGVLYFHPDSIKHDNYDPILYINSFKVHGHEWRPDSINIESKKAIQLSYLDNTISLDISIIDYDPNNNPQYSIFLEGYDTDTISLGEQYTITYPNLKPGQYQFQYNVCKSSGTCRDDFSTFDITITPPFWQTWWFRLLMVLAVTGIGYSGIRLFINNKLRKQQFEFDKQELILKNQLQLQQERNRIADELHDELGGKLSTIKFAGKKVQRAKSIEEVKAITTRVSEISTELIDSMRSIIWAMDSHNDTLDSLLANIRSYSSTLARDNEFSIDFDFPDIKGDIVVKGQIRHHLYLIIKELLHNFIKHSVGDKVVLKISIENNQLVLIFSENGKGFNYAAHEGKGKGLKSIQKRVGLLDASISYDSTSDIKTIIITPLSEKEK